MISPQIKHHVTTDRRLPSGDFFANQHAKGFSQRRLALTFHLLEPLVCTMLQQLGMQVVADTFHQVTTNAGDTSLFNTVVDFLRNPRNRTALAMHIVVVESRLECKFICISSQ